MDKAKEKIPKQCIIGDKCFTSLATIGGNLFTSHPKNLNNVHRDSNNLLSVIIILGTDVHGGETVFYYGDKINDIGKRAHVLNNSHGRCVVGSFDKILHKGSIWTGRRALLYFILHKSIFLHFLHNGTRLYEKYITSNDKNIYIDDYESGFFPKKMLEIYTMQHIKILIQIDIMF